MGGFERSPLHPLLKLVNGGDAIWSPSWSILVVEEGRVNCLTSAALACLWGNSRSGPLT